MTKGQYILHKSREISYFTRGCNSKNKVLAGKDISYFTGTKVQTYLTIFIGLSHCRIFISYFSDTTQEKKSSAHNMHQEQELEKLPNCEQKDKHVLLFLWQWGTNFHSCRVHSYSVNQNAFWLRSLVRIKLPFENNIKAHIKHFYIEILSGLV